MLLKKLAGRIYTRGIDRNRQSLQCNQDICATLSQEILMNISSIFESMGSIALDNKGYIQNSAVIKCAERNFNMTQASLGDNCTIMSELSPIYDVMIKLVNAICTAFDSTKSQYKKITNIPIYESLLFVIWDISSTSTTASYTWRSRMHDIVHIDGCEYVHFNKDAVSKNCCENWQSYLDVMHVTPPSETVESQTLISTNCAIVGLARIYSVFEKYDATKESKETIKSIENTICTLFRIILGEIPDDKAL